VEMLKGFDITVSMSGGETADVGDIVSTIIVDSTIFVRMKREDVIDCDNIKDGDQIVGLASFGKARYEDHYNSGIGSNGFTAARHLLLHSRYKEKYPETFSPTIDRSKVYCGPYAVTDNLPGSDLTVGEALLSPTRTFAPVIKRILENDRKSIHGIIHNTGGGLLKCKSFGKGLHYIKDNLFETPPIFKAIQKSGDIDSAEMFQIFNMGQRLEIYCPQERVKEIIEIANSFTIDARVIGRVETNKDGDANTVTIRYDDKEYRF
ncbi:MAG: hypothetical protein JXJ04_08960, partial [Spirochaetales bacterium]|nr:hypothetical protein [Spirochaetales bacterium]